MYIYIFIHTYLYIYIVYWIYIYACAYMHMPVCLNEVPHNHTNLVVITGGFPSGLEGSQFCEAPRGPMRRHFHDQWLKPLKGAYQAGAWQKCHGFELGIDWGWEQSGKTYGNTYLLPLYAALGWNTSQNHRNSSTFLESNLQRNWLELPALFHTNLAWLTHQKKRITEVTLKKHH